MKINKLLLSIAIATTAVAQFPTMVFANEANNSVVENEEEMNFNDVSPNHWAYDSIKTLVEEYQVIGGFPDGTFRGNRKLSRYEAAALLNKVMMKIEEMAASNGKPSNSNSGVSKRMMEKLKAEFAEELEDIEAKMKRMAKDQQYMQKDIDENREYIEEVEKMIPKIRMTGDVAFRLQAQHNALSGNFSDYGVFAPQARLRLGLEGTSEALGGVALGARLTTSARNDLTNQFVSYGDFNKRVPVSLDQFYVALRPWNVFDLTLGRHINPYFRTTELVFDNDLTFDGAYAKLRLGSASNNLSVLGGHVLLKTSGDLTANPQGGNFLKEDSSGMTTGGAAINLGNDTIKFMLGGNYHTYSNINALVNQPITLNAQTNMISKVDGKDVFTSKYDLATGSLMLALWPEAYLPLTVHGDLSMNLGAGMGADVSDADKESAQAKSMGYVAGVKLGKLVEPGNIMLGYNYKMVGQESVFAPFIEDQLGGTNIIAHEAKFGLMVGPGTSFKVTGQMANQIGAAKEDKPAYTLRAYLSNKF